MYEVEVKFRAAHDAVRAAVQEHDADPAAVRIQRDTYYDAPDRDFAATDEALRLRVEWRTEAARGTNGSAPGSAPTDTGTAGSFGPREPPADATVDLTYKGAKVDTESKTREEATVAVAAAEDADAVLRGLGYAPAATVEKRRERYRLEETLVTLDWVVDLGEFVELERTVDATAKGTADDGTDRDRSTAATDADVPDAVAAARDDLLALARDLGLDPGATVRTSYLGLLLGAATDASESSQA